MDKVVATSTRQRSSSLNKNGKTPQFEVNDDDDDYSSSSEDYEDDKESSKEIKEKDEVDSDEDEDTTPPNTDENDEAQKLSNSAAPSLDPLSTIRQRSASVSPHVARPVIDFDDVISGKIGKTVSVKKRSPTPQKLKRPSVLSEDLFKPPEQTKENEESRLNNLSEVQGSMNLLPENISSKPLEQIVDEVVRVLNKEDIKYRKRKNKFIWKCTADIGHETVQLELEIMNVKNNMCGIMVRRIQGSFPCYQELYQKIKKELNI